MNLIRKSFFALAILFSTLNSEPNDVNGELMLFVQEKATDHGIEK